MSEIQVNTISEYTSANGVTIDGVKLKDNAVETNTISEGTSGSGVTIDGVLIKDSKIPTVGVQQIQESRVTSGTTTSTSTSTWTDISGASVSITPASTSNDIICYATIPVEYTSDTHTAAAAVRIQSNHSGSYANINGESNLTATMGVYNGAGGSRSYHAYTTMFKFSPSTTSAFTIKAQLQTRFTTNDDSRAGNVRGMTLVIGAIEVA
tara:strand:- start:3207 stop:3833 length:627 start_codon:yes stop_codon:yes gene_type:complete